MYDALVRFVRQVIYKGVNNTHVLTVGFLYFKQDLLSVTSFIYLCEDVLDLSGSFIITLLLLHRDDFVLWFL